MLMKVFLKYLKGVFMSLEKRQLNDLLLEGRVVSNPEDTGSFVIKNNDSLFLVVKVQENLVAAVTKNIRKDMTVRIVGELVQYDWKDKYGQQRNSIEIIANHIEWKRGK